MLLQHGIYGNINRVFNNCRRREKVQEGIQHMVDKPGRIPLLFRLVLWRLVTIICFLMYVLLKHLQSCHSSPENQETFSFGGEDWIIALGSCFIGICMRNHSRKALQPRFPSCTQPASLANKLKTGAYEIWVGDCVPKAALKILGGLQVNLPPCSQSVSQRRQQMPCNQYHYKVDRRFPKGSALGGEVGTILSQLVSLRVWSGKQDLQRIQKDFPRNDLFSDVQITGPARPDYRFLLYRRRISVSSACYLWFMALPKSDRTMQRETVFIPSLRSLGSGVEQFPLIWKYLTKTKALKWNCDTGQRVSLRYRLWYKKMCAFSHRRDCWNFFHAREEDVIQVFARVNIFK